MKATGYVASLEDRSDRITVRAIGEFPIEGKAWRSTRTFTFDLPIRFGNKLSIGQALTIEIKPGKKQ